jgi:hypothetical protein
MSLFSGCKLPIPTLPSPTPTFPVPTPALWGPAPTSHPSTPNLTSVLKEWCDLSKLQKRQPVARLWQWRFLPTMNYYLQRRATCDQPVTKVPTLVHNLTSSTCLLICLSSVFSARMGGSCTSVMSALMQHAWTVSMSLAHTGKLLLKRLSSSSASCVTGLLISTTRSACHIMYVQWHFLLITLTAILHHRDSQGMVMLSSQHFYRWLDDSRWPQVAMSYHWWHSSSILIWSHSNPPSMPL